MGVTRGRVTVVAGAVAIAMAGAGAVAASPGSAPRIAHGGTTEAVIVTLADQLTTTPAVGADLARRTSRAKAQQDAILAGLTGRRATGVKHYALRNAFAATITRAQAAALAADPAVTSVVPDRLVSLAPAATTKSGAASAAAAPAIAGPSTVSPAACSSDPSKPLLEPEALQTINARSSDPTAKTAAALGIDGSGVKVAFIADGINPQNAGFLRKNGRSSIVDYKDFYGDGPNAPTSGAEAFGDASAISAQGNVVYDVAKFSNPAVVTYPHRHCYIKIVGVAPGADVVALKAGSELLPNSAILQSIDYAVTVDHVDVINESFGANIVPDAGSRNTIQQFDDAAVAAGVTVTESTGDGGTTSTIGSSATDPLVISAGATTDSRIYEQIGYALATRFSNGTWADDNISSLSSAGYTESGRTIDVSGPGEADWAVCDASGNFSGCTSYRGTYSPIEAFGGTSQSSPFTAGVAALVIQAYRKTHAGASPTPAVVKQIITSTAHDLGFDGVVQGSGELDARAAVEAAFTWPGAATTKTNVSSNVALSTDQLTLEGAPGSTQTGHVTVTNVGTSPVSVVPSTRRELSLGASTQTTSISTSSPQTLPYPTTGAPWVYEKRTFTVPTGADVLSATIRWQSGVVPGQTGPVVRMTLIDPNGTYQANTRPQGGPYPANYGNVLIRRPAAGTWTAILYTPVNGGYSGKVALTADPERAAPIGTVTPTAATLAPGASTDVAVSVPVPAVGGDTSYTMAIASSDGHQVAVPIIARAVVPTSSTTVGRFAGTITGGNARAYTPAQTFTFDFDVPAGQRDLDVSLTLAKDAGDFVTGILIDPNGETPSIASNSPVTAGATNGRSVQNTVADPITGRWHYTVIVDNPVSGKHLTQAFAGRIAFNRVAAAVSGLPATVRAGGTVHATVSITNPGPAPIAVQTDARTTDQQQLQLAPQGASGTFDLPLSVDNIADLPSFLVPPDTSSLALSAASSVPAQVELSSPAFGIDVFGDLQQAQGGSTISTATVAESGSGYVGQGPWTDYVQEIGPFGDGGAPAGTTTLTAQALTAGFDRSVTSSTGDPYLVGVDPTSSPGTAVVIAPGATAQISLTITPTAAAGSTVSGVLNLVTTPAAPPALFNGTGDVLAALPYSYTVR